MQPKQIVVIGTSAGGLEALRTIAATLPLDFPAPICIVMHTSPQAPGVLPDILSRAGRLPAANARNGERPQAGRIYVAPPDCHLVIEPNRLCVTKGPKENQFRPAIDPLFRSAGQVYGPAAIGVILTGNLDDGTAGLWTVKQLGGTAIVQDPEDALYSSMPASALHHVNVDYSVPLVELVPLLVRLTAAPARNTGRPTAPELVEVEVNIANEKNAIDAGLERFAKPSSFACPECHGVLLELEEGGRVRFRCHTGHAYSVESLLSAVSEGIEDSLWIAIRALEEGGLLMERMADHLKTKHDGQWTGEVARLTERAKEARHQSNELRKLVSEREPLAVAKS